MLVTVEVILYFHKSIFITKGNYNNIKNSPLSSPIKLFHPSPHNPSKLIKNLLHSIVSPQEVEGIKIWPQGGPTFLLVSDRKMLNGRTCLHLNGRTCLHLNKLQVCTLVWLFKVQRFSKTFFSKSIRFLQFYYLDVILNADT